MEDQINEQMKKVEKFGKMTDEEFYDEFISEAPIEDQAEFMQDFPEFMTKEKK